MSVAMFDDRHVELAYPQYVRKATHYASVLEAFDQIGVDGVRDGVMMCPSALMNFLFEEFDKTSMGNALQDTSNSIFYKNWIDLASGNLKARKDEYNLIKNFIDSRFKKNGCKEYENRDRNIATHMRYAAIGAIGRAFNDPDAPVSDLYTLERIAAMKSPAYKLIAEIFHRVCTQDESEMTKCTLFTIADMYLGYNRYREWTTQSSL
jgi:hypothetical protein